MTPTPDPRGLLDVAFERAHQDGPTVRATFVASLDGPRVLALFGPSGAGKTTIVRVLAGLDRPTRGRVSFDGVLFDDVETGARVPTRERRVGYVRQDDDLFPHLTAAENAGFGCRGGAAERRRAGAAALADLGLSGLEDRRPRELSGGQRRRVALARALVLGPKLLLLDEPCAGLDATAKEETLSVLRAKLRVAGIPAVMVSHDPDEVFALADDVALVDDGAVLQIGPTAETFSRPNGAAAARVTGVETVLAARVVATDGAFADVSVGSARLRALAPLIPVGPALVCIRADAVVLQRASEMTSARNVLRVRVLRAEPSGAMMRVALDAGFPLAALVTRAACDELALVSGAEVDAIVKAPHVHVVARAP
jgi:molybdate transport system ATP-binding protein